MNVEDSCRRFFGVSLPAVGDTDWDCAGSSIERQERAGFDRAIGFLGDRPKNTTPSSFIYSKNRAFQNRKNFISDWLNLLRTQTQSFESIVVVKIEIF